MYQASVLIWDFEGSCILLTHLQTFFQAIVAALFMNIYIVGLNQLFDIEIDKVLHKYLFYNILVN